jgi:acyl-CoA thioesterase-1
MKTLPLKIILVVASLMLPYAAQAARNILVFGDSLSAGYGIARDAAWASLLQKELQQSHPQIEVVNASISGETTSGGLRRIGKALQEHKPYIIIIELGANDALRGSSIGETENNLREIIEQSLKSKSKVILLGMQIPPNYGLDYSKKFRELYPMLAKQYKLSLVPFMLEGIPPEQFQADNLHPNEQAQARILKNIERALKPLL